MWQKTMMEPWQMLGRRLAGVAERFADNNLPAWQTWQNLRVERVVRSKRRGRCLADGIFLEVSL